MSGEQLPESSALHVLVDARWLGEAGSGRVTQVLLTGLQRLQPPGRWSIWGTADVEPFLWPGATRVPSRHHPHAWYSQREIPGPRSLRADVAFFAHQMRPGWRVAAREITTVYDTIPVRYPTMPFMARPMTAFLRHMANMSDAIATFSDHARRTISADLRTGDIPVVRLPMPIDATSADRVMALRRTSPRSSTVVYVGADFPHKNLDRLLRAFGHTDFHGRGGTLVLVGMNEAGTERLRTVASGLGVRVHVAGRVPQDQLESLLATADALVQPSLEEGFGLPVAEAMAAGIPVAVSTGGSLPEVVDGAVPLFDPLDEEAIARAIDDAVGRQEQARPVRPTELDLARAAHELVVTTAGAPRHRKRRP